MKCIILKSVRNTKKTVGDIFVWRCCLTIIRAKKRPEWMYSVGFSSAARRNQSQAHALYNQAIDFSFSVGGELLGMFRLWLSDGTDRRKQSPFSFLNATVCLPPFYYNETRFVPLYRHHRLLTYLRTCLHPGSWSDVAYVRRCTNLVRDLLILLIAVVFIRNAQPPLKGVRFQSRHGHPPSQCMQGYFWSNKWSGILFSCSL